MRRALIEVAIMAVWVAVPSLFLGLGFWLLPDHGTMPRWLPFALGAIGGLWSGLRARRLATRQR